MPGKPLRQTGAQCAIIAVLAAAGGEVYGRQVAAITGLPSGTVAPALSRLEQRGYTVSRWESPEAARAEGRTPRRYYRLTGAGQQLAAEWHPAASV